MTDEQRCKGKIRNGERAGERCRKSAMKGRDFCRSHGGKTKIGPEHPRFKHGRWSKLMPMGMMAVLGEAATDPDYISLIDEIMVNDALLGDAIRRLETGESESIWLQLQRLEAELRRARGDSDRMLSLLTEMGRVIRLGASWVESNREIANRIELRRKLVESERKRAVELQTNITLQQWSTFIATLSDVLGKRVGDARIISGIFTDIERAFGGRSSGSADVGRTLGDGSTGDTH